MIIIIIIIIVIIIIIIIITKIIIIIIIIIITTTTLFESQVILAEHECCTNWRDCKSNKSNQMLDKFTICTLHHCVPMSMFCLGFA